MYLLAICLMNRSLLLLKLKNQKMIPILVFN